MILTNAHPDASIRGFPDLRTHRRDEAYTYRSLTRDGTYLGPLDGVAAGSLSLNLHADIRGTGRIEWSGLERDMPDWRQVMVAVAYQASTWDRRPLGWPLGVYHCASAAVTRHGGGVVSCEVSLYDRTLPARRNVARDDWTPDLPALVVPLVRGILGGRGITTHVIEDDPDGHAVPPGMAWDAGTSWMVIMNDLLATIGYEGLWADPYGTVRSRPYVLPGDRPVTDRLVAGPDAIHIDGSIHDRDDFDTPNLVVVRSRSDGDERPALSGLVDLNTVRPGHPLSEAVTGYYVDRIEEVDAASQAVVDAQARRLLLEGVGAGSTVTAEHAPMPWIPGVRVALDPVPSGTIESMEIDLEPGGLCRTVLREVAA